MVDDSLYHNNVAVFSYLNVYALMVFGGVCCAFVVVAIFNLFSLFVVRPSFRYDVYRTMTHFRIWFRNQRSS